MGFDPWVRKIPWRRVWQLTPGFSPGESHGQRSLAGYSSYGCKESDMTERIQIHTHTHTHTCTMYWLDVFIHCSITTIIVALADTSIISHNYHFFFEVRTIRIQSLSKFAVHSTVLLTIMTVMTRLCIRSPELTHLLTLSLDLETSSQFPAPSPGIYHSNLFLWVQLLWFPHISDIIRYLSFSVWLISLIMPSKSIHRWPQFLLSSDWITFHYKYIIYTIFHYIIWICIMRGSEARYLNQILDLPLKFQCLLWHSPAV